MIEITPVDGIPEVEPGTDLGTVIARAIENRGVRSRDVVVVTQKVVSKAEFRLVDERDGGKAAWVERESARIVARRGDLVIAETRHGFVCANAGVDASNVPRGTLTLLPEDPDASAERIRRTILGRCRADVGVVITDTFGRPWRNGLTNVAIGCAGLPALIDLRGTKDAGGRILEATVVAFADEIAAAAGLVMGKADGVPVALLRGLKWSAPPGTATDLIRPASEDLFRSSPLQAIADRRTIRTFGDGEVARESVEEAVAAACTAPAPHHSRPWTFLALNRGPVRRRLLAAMSHAWRHDLLNDGTAPAVIERRIERSNALLGEAPLLVIPLISLRDAHTYRDAERTEAEREMFVLAGGAAIENLLLALHARGLAACWVSSTLFCKEETRRALGLGPEWTPLGSVALGPPPADAPAPRPPLQIDEHLRFLD